MSKYAEVYGNYYSDIEEKQFVEAWFTNDDNEEGVVIAKVDLANKTVEYLDEDAKSDEYAQEVINEILNEKYVLTE